MSGLGVDERLSVAPMLDWTDPHLRMLLRTISRKTVLYTEMVVDEAVIHTENLDFMVGRGPYHMPSPSVIQIGGSDPTVLANATERLANYSNDSGIDPYYQEINLNCGCPSQRVAMRCFGAKLMLEPELVRQCVSEMSRKSGNIPITVKCRIGVDDNDSYEELTKFIGTVATAGTKKFVIHARKCLLNGLNPKQNREIPPLHYDVAHRLAKDFPDLTFVLNGGIQTLSDAKKHLAPNSYWHSLSTPSTAPVATRSASNGVDKHAAQFDLPADAVKRPHVCDSADEQPARLVALGEEELPPVHGVMIGRAVYNSPLLLATADSEFFGVADQRQSRRDIVEKYLQYCEWAQGDDGPRRLGKNGKPQTVTTSILLNGIRNFFNGAANVAKFRVAMNDEYVTRVRKGNPNPSPREILEAAMEHLEAEELDAILGNEKPE